MTIITLTSDFGIKDHYVGALKGKLLSNISDANIIDISHLITAYNVIEASFVVSNACFNFPKGTIHIVAVDMECNREQSHVIVCLEGQYFICADNGILSLILNQNKQASWIFSFDRNNEFLSEKTDLDLFAFYAQLLAHNLELAPYGKMVPHLKNLLNMAPKYFENRKSLIGNAIYFDNYGNVITNISKRYFEEVSDNREFVIIFKSDKITKIHKKYSDIGDNYYKLSDQEGDLMARFNELDLLEISVYKGVPNGCGTAKSLFAVEMQDIIEIKFLDNNVS